jgi:hypothetical protein
MEIARTNKAIERSNEQSKIRFAEIKTLLDLERNPDRAKQSAKEYARDAAGIEQLPAPSDREFEAGKLDPGTQNAYKEKVDTSTAGLQKIAADPDLNLQDCINALPVAGKVLDPTALKDKKNVQSLQDCKRSLDAQKQKIDRQWKEQNCDKNPNTSACTQLAKKRKQVDQGAEFLKIILTIAGLIAMVNGDVTLGLLLLSMANSGGTGGSGDGGDEPNNQVATAPAETPGVETTPNQQATVTSDFGHGGNGPSCTGGAKISCTLGTQTIAVGAFDTENIDPSNPQCPTNFSDACEAFRSAIATKNRESLEPCSVAPETNGTFLKGYIVRLLSDSGSYASIQLKRKAAQGESKGEFTVIYPGNGQRAALNATTLGSHCGELVNAGR